MAANTDKRLSEALDWLKRNGARKTRDGMAGYGITAEKAFGVTMGDMKKLGKQLGRDHALADGLWKSGWYEARMLTAFVDEPEKVTAQQMDRWCREFDNWSVCDTVCFHLFDRTPHALKMVDKWAKAKGEFQKRAAFALLACVALHDKQMPDKPFIDRLPLIEQGSTDERNFVKKAVVWALRSIGERSPALNKQCVALAGKLAATDDATARWIGKDALKGLTSPAAKKRLAKK